jgi:hypothetical protein
MCKEKTMKKLLSILAAFLIFVITPGCKKDDSYMNNAVIIGEDARLCVCCGGLEITIENVQSPNGVFFLAGNLPSDFNLGDPPKFPIPVKLDWKIDSVHCRGTFILVSRIARR